MEQDYDPKRVAEKRNQFLLISGCSGGGKSALLAELERRGFVTFEEPGRQVIKEQMQIGGNALPTGDLDLFIELTVSRSIHHLIEAARGDRIAFFDRGIIDQISAFDSRGLVVPAHLRKAADQFRYRESVFLVPPWEEIFVNDAERTHNFAQAVAMYATLVSIYERFGYRPVTVPKVSVSARAEFVIRQLRV